MILVVVGDRRHRPHTQLVQLLVIHPVRRIRHRLGRSLRFLEGNDIAKGQSQAKTIMRWPKPQPTGYQSAPE